MNRRSVSVYALLGLLALALAALACGSLNLAGLQTTLESAVEEVAPTLEAQMTLIGPSLQAYTTEIAGQATQHAPELALTLTAVVGTADALGDPAFLATGEALMTQAAGTAQAVFAAGGAGAEGPPIYDGGDGYATIMVETIALNAPRTVSLPAISQAHNWLFMAAPNQTVHITVTGAGECDPRVHLIGPDGHVIYQMDDIDTSGRNYNVDFTYTLPVEGLFTIRVDAIVPGEYTITVGG
jgi:hypothetical protein